MGKSSEATLLLLIKTAGEEVLSKTGDALKELGKLAVTAYAAANAAAAASIHAYREQELATNSLNQALINQGIYSKGLSDKYQDMAQALQKTTTYADEAIVSAQAQLQKYLGQTEVTKDLTKATLDFAAAMHMDLDSAATVVGKSIGTATNALGRYGITMDEATPKTEKLNEVIRGLNSRFGGQAEAAAAGLGSLTQMKNAMGDIMEVAGQKLAPVVIYLSRQMTAFAEEVQKNREVLQGFTDAARGLGYAGVFIQSTFAGVGEVLGAVFGTQMVAWSQAIDGNFKMAFETIKSGTADVLLLVENRYKSYTSKIQGIDEVFRNQKKNEEKDELRRVQENANNKLRIESDTHVSLKDMLAVKDEKEIEKLKTQEELKSDIKLQSLTLAISREQDVTKKLELENEKRKYLEDQYVKHERARMTTLDGLNADLNSSKVVKFEAMLTSMEAMSKSKNKILVNIGKAAAIAHIGINTAQATMAAFRWGTELGGPILGSGLALPIAAYGAEQIATASGIELAEGGIVKATPGGVMAKIGEGGRDEAVIPLDKAGGMMGGSKISITVNGGFLGNDLQAKEFALALDKELLKLRQSNESLAFERGII